MTHDTVSRMPWTDDFDINHSTRIVQLRDTSNGANVAEASSASFEKVISQALEDDTFSILHKTRSEPYRIIGANVFTHLQRFSHPLFGIVSRGAHLTAYVNTPDGIKIWVPRRARHLFTYPGKLDTTVAGGIKATNTPLECIIDEAMEEASLPEDLIQERLRSVGTLTYMALSRAPDGREKGLIHPDVVYLFDIELPSEVVPKPNDDEVEQFYLMTPEEVKKAIFDLEFKTNSAVVMIDFFVRHGIVTPENEPDYVEITARLHRRLPIPTAPSVR
jgi:8-oxo-dGTP pyrophosphatase MutT (NUDIX family)